MGNAHSQEGLPTTNIISAPVLLAPVILEYVLPYVALEVNSLPSVYMGKNNK